jgi:hypothetical protein
MDQSSFDIIAYTYAKKNPFPFLLGIILNQVVNPGFTD